MAGSSVLLDFTSNLLISVLAAAGLVVEGAGVQLLRFLSPNTGRGNLCSPADSFACLMREVQLGTVLVTTRAFLTSVFRTAGEGVVLVVEEEEEDEGGVAERRVQRTGSRGNEVEPVAVGSADGALLRVVSCFPVDPPPF